MKDPLRVFSRLCNTAVKSAMRAAQEQAPRGLGPREIGVALAVELLRGAALAAASANLDIPPGQEPGKAADYTTIFEQEFARLTRDVLPQVRERAENRTVLHTARNLKQ